jgi:hypothetical protein
LAGAAGVVVGVLAAATIAAFEIAGRVDHESGVVNSVTETSLATGWHQVS